MTPALVDALESAWTAILIQAWRIMPAKPIDVDPADFLVVELALERRTAIRCLVELAELQAARPCTRAIDTSDTSRV